MKIIEGKTVIKDIKGIYLDSFQKRERVPFSFLCLRAKSKYVDFLAFKDNDEVIGFSYCLKNKTLSFILYIAIKKEKQSKGYGSEALRLLKERYKDVPISLFVHKEEDERREKFYTQNGFHLEGFSYKEGSFNYRLMVNSDNFDKDTLNTLIEHYSFGFASIRPPRRITTTSSLKL